MGRVIPCKGADRSVSGKYYITTPIYYPSERLHIGHAYTTVLCDAAARWRRMAGEETRFLTGSDEHGLKVLRSAQAKGKEPKPYVDEIVATFKELWRRLDVSYDVFLRTTEERHAKVVREIFTRLYEKGDIYKGKYDGWYCTPCETFWPESKLPEGEKVCPDCSRPVEWVEEESYFFRISRYADRLLAHIEANPHFIQPESRRNEMVSFIKSGLEDLSVTRTTFDWGIRVPFDPKHVVYVWIDALTNYLTGAGYLEDDQEYAKWWPAECHVVGKDILRFHTIIWPAILLAADLPLPESVYGHGWLLVDTGKMSKSKGNVVDPNRLIDRFGADALRYFLLREVPFGHDARYSTEALIERINFDLANDLGNALHRSIAMLERFCGGVVPAAAEPSPLEDALRELAEETRWAVDKEIRTLHASAALAELWKLVRAINKYIDDAQPWRLAKERDEARLNTVMAHLFAALRVVALLVSPFMPSTGQKMWEHLGLKGEALAQGFDATRWTEISPGTRVQAGPPLFPRLDVDEVLAELDEGEEQAPSAPQPASQSSGQSGASSESSASRESGASSTSAAQRASAALDKGVDPVPTDELISIEEFAKVQLRLARVLSAEKIQGADKLLKLKVDLGGEERQVVAGIAMHYAPEALVGKRVVIVANLKPAKLRGEISQGMILAAVDDEGKLGVVTVEEELAPGSVVR